MSTLWAIRRPAVPGHAGLVLGLVLVGLLAVLALFGQWLTPHDPDLVDLGQRLMPPDASHWLGTDHLGRDLLSRLIVGTRLSLGSVMLTLALVLALGLAVGGLAGFVGELFGRFGRHEPGVGVAPYPVAALSAQQLPDRLAQPFAFDVPTGHFQAGQRTG